MNKKKLHDSLVRCSKIKRDINEALHQRTREPIQLWDSHTSPHKLVTQPQEVGEVLSDCLASLGGDPYFEVPEAILKEFISRLPKLPKHTATQPLPTPTMEWFNHTIQQWHPSKATGEDKINFHVLLLCPPSIRLLFFDAVAFVIRHGSPVEWSRSRVCLL